MAKGVVGRTRGRPLLVGAAGVAALLMPGAGCLGSGNLMSTYVPPEDLSVARDFSIGPDLTPSPADLRSLPDGAAVPDGGVPDGAARDGGAHD